MGKRIPDDDPAWQQAQKACRLDEETLRMAKALGFTPQALMESRPSPQEKWKAPVADWVRRLYAEKKPPMRPPPGPPKPRVTRPAAEVEAENAVRSARFELFNRLAPIVAAAFSEVPEVWRIELFGALTLPLEPQAGGLYRPYDRLPLAVWVDDLACMDRLRELRQATLEAAGETIDAALIDVHVVPPMRGSTTWTRRLDRPQSKVELKRMGYGGQHMRVLFDRPRS